MQAPRKGVASFLGLQFDAVGRLLVCWAIEDGGDFESGDAFAGVVGCRVEMAFEQAGMEWVRVFRGHAGCEQHLGEAAFPVVHHAIVVGVVAGDDLDEGGLVVGVDGGEGDAAGGGDVVGDDGFWIEGGEGDCRGGRVGGDLEGFEQDRGAVR
ncbi:MAG: hypothetical protein WCL39_12665, partial [Armatimonadota bacterium]